MGTFKERPKARAGSVDDAATEYTPADDRRRLVFGPWRGFLRAVVHLPAIMMTAVMLWVHYDNIFWFDEDGISGISETSANNILNSLQLLAKIYEIAVVASLAHITVKAFKRRLLGDGLPAGFLTGGYRVGDLFYLLGTRFRAAFSGAVFLALLLILNTIISVLVGPASAILIVPELGWFAIREPFWQGVMPVTMQRPDVHWPSLLRESAELEDAGCAGDQASYNIECPGAGFAPLYTWAAGWATAGLADHVFFPDPTGKTTRRLDMHTNETRGTFATVPMSAIASTVGQLEIAVESRLMGKVSAFPKYSLGLKPNDTMPVYQPMIQVKCFVWNLDEPGGSSSNLAMDEALDSWPGFNCYDGEDDGPCHDTRRLVREEMRRQGRPRVDDEDQAGIRVSATRTGGNGTSQSPTSLLFSAQLPFRRRDASDGDDMGVRHVRCGTLSHWIPTTFSVDPTTSPLMETNVTDVGIFQDERGWRAATGGGMPDRMIHIDESWVPYIDARPGVAGANGTGNATDGTGRPSRLGNLMRALSPDARGEYVGLESDPYEYQGTSGDIMREIIKDKFKDKNGRRGLAGRGAAGVEKREKAEQERTSDENVRRNMERFVAAVLTDAVSRTAAVVDPGAFITGGEYTDEPVTLLNLRYITSLPRPDKWHDVARYPNGSVFDGSERLRDEEEEGINELWDERLRSDASLDFSARRYGYGYGHAEGTRTFALAVIYSYLAVLFSYLLYVAVAGADAVHVWGDLQDLLTLAWASKAPQDVKGRGSGVRNKRFWKENVAIRASASGAVTLSLEDEDGIRLRRKGEYT